MTELHVVTFDVNVYLDVADLVGAGFTWESFTSHAVEIASLPCPASDKRKDSLRAVAVVTSGALPNGSPVQVWTSDHIADLVFTKLTQPLDGATPEERGLGWTEEDAESLFETLHETLVLDKTSGDYVREGLVARHSPPLDHEDGMVYATSLEAGTASNGGWPYLVTQDAKFRAAAPSNVEALSPAEFLQYVRGLNARRGPRPPTL